VNFSELQSRVLARLSTDTNDPIADRVGDYVNEGIHYLETMAPDGWPWMRETVTMTTTVAAYTFTQLGTQASSNSTHAIAKVLSVKVLNQTYYQPLTYRTIDEADQLYPAIDNQGLPESYTVDGSTLTILPTPQTAGYLTKIRVVTVEPDLSASSDMPVLPSQFHGAIVDAASYMAYKELQDGQTAATYEQQINRWVDRFRRYGNQAEGIPKIKVREHL
jgi:hypothetical protein